MLAVEATCLNVNTPWGSTTQKPSSDHEHRCRARNRYYSYRPERRSEMIREEATELILEAKKKKELTFEAKPRRLALTRSGPLPPCSVSIL